MYHFTALITCLAILVYAYASILVSQARQKFGVKLPAISGNPDFERVFRAHMNTLEWLPMFLPSLWLFAIYIGDGIAASLGLVWIVGRILYILGYAQARASLSGSCLRRRVLHQKYPNCGNRLLVHERRRMPGTGHRQPLGARALHRLEGFRQQQMDLMTQPGALFFLQLFQTITTNGDDAFGHNITGGPNGIVGPKMTGFPSAPSLTTARRTISSIW